MAKYIVFPVLLCITTVLIKWTNSYVLLAANLEDFKKVAKKFVPEKLAMQIAEIATASSMRKEPIGANQPVAGQYADDLPAEEEMLEERAVPEEEPEEGPEEGPEDEPSPRYETGNLGGNAEFKSLDFEDLVQQVKSRIEKDMLKKTAHFNQHTKNAYLQQPAPKNQEIRIIEKDYPEQNDPDDKYHVEKFSYKKRPVANSEESYPGQIQQEEKRPASSYIKEKPQQYHKKKQLGREKMKQNQEIRNVKQRSDEKPYDEIHQQDEIDDRGAVIHSYPKQESKQRQKNAPKRYDDYEYVATNPDDHKIYNENNAKPLVEVEEDGEIYKKISMLTNDSYEDYAPPKREKNIYASKEKQLKKTAVKVKDEIAQEKPEVSRLTGKFDEYDEPPNNYYNDNVDNLKARTENLAEYSGENHPKVTTPVNDSPASKSNTKRKGKATMIPKRDFYKISTPNYYGKLPIVAEKYDFNEPIPEKDREEEVTKAMLLPPAIINGKVRINQENREKFL